MNDFKVGYNELTNVNELHTEMLMDTGIYVLESGNTASFMEKEKESAFLLLTGKINISWENNTENAQRNSVFHDKPTCLHVPSNVEVTINAIENAEILIQKTENKNSFAPVYYSASDLEDKILCGDIMHKTARRVLRDIFNYSNAPYSNMVMGEVITFPGKWSSYPPHQHPQPEVYFHRFDREQGFGVSIVGEDAKIVKNNSVSIIPGGQCHPQVSAPGYAMYYCWMIRHFDGNPWTERIDDPLHTWLYDKNAEIFDISEDMQ